MSNEQDGALETRKQSPGALVEIEQARAIQEVQGAIIIARKFPRDEKVALGKILKACERKELAEQATYAFPRGDQTVTGPSIRIAEVLAQAWGNMQTGVRELSRTRGESTAQSYAWDLETNMRAEKTFQVKHWRDTKGGGYAITSERDIYEAVANQGARRQRACILAVIPGDVVDAALAACEKTLDAKQDPFDVRLKKMVEAFAAIKVTVQALEAKLHKKLDAFTPADLKSMGRVLLTIQDGMAKASDYFAPKAEPGKDVRASVAEKAGQSRGGGIRGIFGGGKPGKLDVETGEREPEPEGEDEQPELY
jgi:hypothetical protein